MHNQNILDSFVMHLKVSEVLEIFEAYLKERESAKAKLPPTETRGDLPKFVYGMAGIASIFGCSVPTAARLKKSKVLDPAITQVGKTIVCDTYKALELVRAQKGGAR